MGDVIYKPQIWSKEGHMDKGNGGGGDGGNLPPIGERMALMEEKIKHIDQSLNSIKENVDKRFDKMEDKVDSNIHWTVGIFVSILIGVLGLIWTSFHTTTQLEKTYLTGIVKNLRQ